MSGQAGADEVAIAAFKHAFRAIMLVTASCAALAGLIGFVWMEPDRAHAKG